MTSNDRKNWIPTNPRDEKRLIDILARMVAQVLFHNDGHDESDSNKGSVTDTLEGNHIDSQDGGENL